MTLSLDGRTVALVGAGTQGRRLAYMWASQGRDVVLIDGQSSQLDASLKYIESLQTASQAERPAPGKARTFSPNDMRNALEKAWLVVECVPEKLDLKRQVITQLDEVAPKDAIIASNSSSYSISEIVSGLNLPNAHRILSAHSYWPPETVALEIMGHSTTDEAAISLLLEQSRLHGFSPFHVKQDSMGYIYNRIWAAIKREALLTASEGVATPQEIDEIFKDVLKTPKGPFEQMDVVGLDVVLNIEENYAAKRKDIPSEPRNYLKQFVEKGKLGVKTGNGFYNYENSDQK